MRQRSRGGAADRWIAFNTRIFRVAGGRTAPYHGVMNAQKTMTSRAWAELTLLSVIWGGSFLAVELALVEMGPLTAVAHRVGWAAPLLWLYVRFRGLPVPRAPRVWLAFLVMGVLNNVLPFSLIAWGQQHIESGLAAILNATTAVFGVLLASLVFADERLTPARIAGVTLGFAGVVVVIGPDALSGFDLRSAGLLAVVGAALSYSFAAVWARAALGGLPPQVSAAGMVSAAALVMVPAALLVEGAPDFALMPVTWAAIAFYALGATVAAYLLYYRVLGMAGSGNLMLTTILIVPVAVLLGAVVLDEALPPTAFAGFGLIAAGMAVLDGRILRALAQAALNRQRKSRKPARKP